MDEETQKFFPIDHAGKQETSLMLAFCPEGVDMKKHNKKHWYAKAATETNLDYGNKAKNMILASVRKILS